MRTTCLTIPVALMITAPATAQSWDIHMGAGLSFARLMPQQQSTPSNEALRYGYDGGGIYASPELHFAANEHHHFTFGYQYSINGVGVQFRTGVSGKYYDEEHDAFDMHNFSVGYQYHHNLFNRRLHIAAFGKMGLAYGYGTGSGGSTNSGGYGNTSFTYYELTQEGHVGTAFWTPNSTVGIALGPNFKGKQLANRLTLQASVTTCWKSIYSDYSTVSYTLIDASGQSRKGVMQYQGTPLIVQVGIDYNVLRFKKE